jgi:hypothetical protein
MKPSLDANVGMACANVCDFDGDLCQSRTLTKSEFYERSTNTEANRKLFAHLVRSPKPSRVVKNAATERSLGSGCTKFVGMGLQRMVNEVRYGERLWPHL